MSIPPELTLAANVSLFAMMLWKRVSSPALWLIEGPSIAGTVLLKWNDFQFQIGNLSANGYDLRLRNAQMVELACEAAAILFLYARFRIRKPCCDEEVCVAMVGTLHSLTLASFWIDFMLGWPVDVPLQVAARIWNLGLIAAMFWAVSFYQRNPRLGEDDGCRQAV